jgi:hypothetical protein
MIYEEEKWKDLKYTITIDPTTQNTKPPTNNAKVIIYHNLKLVTAVTIDEFVTITSVNKFCLVLK